MDIELVVSLSSMYDDPTDIGNQETIRASLIKIKTMGINYVPWFLLILAYTSF